MNSFQVGCLKPIGIIHSCFKEKFGIPRQSGLIPAAEATLEFLPPFDRDEAIRGLKTFSHLWILFLFHAQTAGYWRPTVRPPRLGGNKRIGVFASRSPFRPNPIGLSAVRLLNITRIKKHLTLHLGGVDLLDKTPVLDIKPYLPYADAITDAYGNFTCAGPELSLPIYYVPVVREFLAGLEVVEAEQLKSLITGVLTQAPYPAYLNVSVAKRIFGMHILSYDIRWSVTSTAINILSIAQFKTLNRG